MQLRNLNAVIAGLALAIAGVNAQAAGVSLEVGFTDSDYQVGPTDSFADLIAAYAAGTPIAAETVTALEGVATSVYAGGISGDYGVLMAATLDIADPGSYRFQVGADWGRGGGVALIDGDTGGIVEELVTSEDIWWSNDWSHGDVIETEYELAAGLYEIAWIGFEGCCAGSSTIRFAHEGGAFAALNMDNIAPHVVPVPASVYLLASSLVLLGIRARRPATV